MRPATPKSWLEQLPQIIGGAALLLLLPLAWPDERAILTHDYLEYQLPVREFARAEMLAGRFPHWMPHLSCGSPLHASQQAALAYPLLTPLVLLLGANLGIRVSLVLSLLLCYLGVMRLARYWELSPAAGTMAAVMATFSGFAMGHLAAGHVNLVLAYGLIPWFFLAVIAIGRRPSPATAVGLALISALLVLTGHPQVPYYTLLAGGLWWIGTLCARQTAGRRLQIVGYSLLAGLLAGCLAAVQLLPSMELVLNAAPGQSGIEHASSMALVPLDVIRYLVPSALGNPFRDVPAFDEPPWYYHEKAAYLSLAAWLLITVAITRREDQPWQRGIVCISVLLLMIALGTSTPLFRLLGSVLPGLYWFRAPGRALAVACVLLPLVAGSGWDALCQRRPGVRTRYWVMGLSFAMLAGGWLLACWRVEPTPLKYVSYVGKFGLGSFVVAGLLLAAYLLIAVFAWRSKQRSSILGGLLVLLITVDLCLAQVRNLDLGRPPKSAKHINLLTKISGDRWCKNYCKTNLIEFAWNKRI